MHFALPNRSLIHLCLSPCLKILSTLKISEEDWAVMCEHALRAVEHDTRLRFWAPTEGAGAISALIYKSNAAEIDLESGPAGEENNILLPNVLLCCNKQCS